MSVYSEHIINLCRNPSIGLSGDQTAEMATVTQQRVRGRPARKYFAVPGQF